MVKTNNFFLNNLRQMRMIICFLMCSIFSFAQQEVPILKEIVTDNANIFDSSEKELLKNKLTSFETETTTQIVVLTVKSLKGNTVEDYALKVFNKNKLGQKNVDNGILILFSKLDKKVRIEVGYGLESTITDALASRIIRQIMVPNFKKEQYSKGIDEGSSKLMELINDPELIEEFLSAVEEDKSKDKSDITTRIIGSLFLTFISLIILLVTSNIVFEKNKRFNILRFYRNNTIIFYLLLFLVISLGTFFFKYYLILFFALIIIAAFSYFFYVGINHFIKPSFEAFTSLFEDVFTGNVGIFIFPFYFIFSFIPLLIGSVCVFVPFLFIVFLGVSSLKIKSEVLHPLFFLYIFITILILLIVVNIVNAIINFRKKRETFNFSFFTTGIEFTSISRTGSSSSRSSSSRSSFSSSSSSSSSSFSGGGGSSGGGGASGSW